MESVTGVVQDTRGNPVADAIVAVEWASVPYPDMALRTDLQGQFQITLPAGKYRLAARTSDGGYGSTDFDTKSGKTKVAIRIGKS